MIKEIGKGIWELESRDKLSPLEIAQFVLARDPEGKADFVVHASHSVPADATTLLPEWVRAKVLKRTNGLVPTFATAPAHILRFYESTTYLSSKESKPAFHLYSGVK